jgi:hypothetical protein
MLSLRSTCESSLPPFPCAPVPLCFCVTSVMWEQTDTVTENYEVIKVVVDRNEGYGTSHSLSHPHPHSPFLPCLCDQSDLGAD